MGKLGFTDSESDFLSFGEFCDLYKAYQQVFDIESTMNAAKYLGNFKCRYLDEEQEEQEEIIFF